MVANSEIVLAAPHGPTARTEAVFDLAAAQASAAADALSHYRRSRFRAEAIEDAGELLALRAVTVLSDQLEAGPEQPHPVTVRLELAGVRLLAEVCAYYVAERDVDGYQSPEERERIGLLAPLAESLRELAAQVARAGLLAAPA